MPLGAHMSIAGGIYRALKRGREVGCETIQIFTKNNTRWKGKNISRCDVEKYFELKSKYNIEPVVAHDCYLINLAASNKITCRKSLRAFEEEIRNAGMLKLPYLIFHPGAHTGLGEKKGLVQIARSLNGLMTLSCSPLVFLLETTAGQGTSLGWRFEQMADIIARVRQSERVGVCYDTCHTFAAGYDIRTRRAYLGTFREFDRIIGLDKLKVFHLNDSKGALGSRLDRHEHIGKGNIGLDGFRFIINDRRFKNIPMILETPKEDKRGRKMDRVNLRVLRSLVKS